VAVQEVSYAHYNYNANGKGVFRPDAISISGGPHKIRANVMLTTFIPNGTVNDSYVGLGFAEYTYRDSQGTDVVKPLHSGLHPTAGTAYEPAISSNTMVSFLTEITLYNAKASYIVQIFTET
jgi:hypothetical protein